MKPTAFKANSGLERLLILRCSMPNTNNDTNHPIYAYLPSHVCEKKKKSEWGRKKYEKKTNEHGWEFNNKMHSINITAEFIYPMLPLALSPSLVLTLSRPVPLHDVLCKTERIHWFSSLWFESRVHVVFIICTHKMILKYTTEMQFYCSVLAFAFQHFRLNV